MLHVINVLNYEEKAEWGLNQYICNGHPSRNRCPHLKFNKFNISFHNLGKIFRKQCSDAHTEFHVCAFVKPFLLHHYFKKSILFQETHLSIIDVLRYEMKLWRWQAPSKMTHQTFDVSDIFWTVSSPWKLTCKTDFCLCETEII